MSNFTFFGNVDIKILKEKILDSGEQIWNENKQRQTYHETLNQTQFIPLMWDVKTISELIYGKKTKYFEIFDFDSIKDDIQNEINSKLNLDGIVYRAILSKLGFNNFIPKHTDGLKSTSPLRKIHIPIITNDDVIFEIEDEKKNLKEGEIWGVDVSKMHSVCNKGSIDRVHLIVMYSERKEIIQESFDY